MGVTLSDIPVTSTISSTYTAQMPRLLVQHTLVYAFVYNGVYYTIYEPSKKISELQYLITFVGSSFEKLPDPKKF